MKSIFLAIIFFTSTILYGQDKIVQIDKNFLIGHWTSVDDKKYTIVVTDSTFDEYYDKEKTATFLYKLDRDKLTKTDKDDGDVYKYNIVSLTNERLTLLYLDKGNLLKFIKTK
jgi:hypothetical protein